MNKLGELPKQLEKFSCNNNHLKEIPDLPEELRSLRCDYNELEVLPELPPTLDMLYCYNNKLKELPDSLADIIDFVEIKYEYNPVHEEVALEYASDILDYLMRDKEN